MIVVLDTTVIVAAMAAKGLCPQLDELEHTLRAKFTLGPASRTFLEQLRRRLRIVEAARLNAPVSRDADDDVVFSSSAATTASISYLHATS